jgi:hypothetical protein
VAEGRRTVEREDVRFFFKARPDETCGAQEPRSPRDQNAFCRMPGRILRERFTNSLFRTLAMGRITAEREASVEPSGSHFQGKSAARRLFVRPLVKNGARQLQTGRDARVFFQGSLAARPKRVLPHYWNVLRLQGAKRGRTEVRPYMGQDHSFVGSLSFFSMSFAFWLVGSRVRDFS